MSSSVLAQLILGYQLVWNRLRQPVAVQLFVDTNQHGVVDAAHLLATLAQAWSEQSPKLILSVQSRQLLAGLLEHATPDGPWIAVQDIHLGDPEIAAQVHRAHLRGLQMVWRGEPGQRANAAIATSFTCNVITLTAGEALLGLRASLHRHHADEAPAKRVMSPVLAGQIYESVASRILVEHCLDEQAAWGVAGWPMEDVLHAYRHQPIQPYQRTIVRLVEAADADAPMETIEYTLAQEPVLAYRFLRYANSAAFGLRTGIDSLRHGLMVLGLSTFKNWLLEQLPHATSDLNLQPVRAAMVLRARLMEHLLDAGEEVKLRREITLCGLLSQIDLMLGEPLGTALQRLPISERITDAILGNSGPYAPFLAIAAALEYPNSTSLPSLCDTHRIDIGEVNRSLLRVLAQAQPHRTKGRLLD